MAADRDAAPRPVEGADAEFTIAWESFIEHADMDDAEEVLAAKRFLRDTALHFWLAARPAPADAPRAGELEAYARWVDARRAESVAADHVDTPEGFQAYTRTIDATARAYRAWEQILLAETRVGRAAAREAARGEGEAS